MTEDKQKYLAISFPEGLIKEPILYSLVSRYRLQTNIYRAEVSVSSSWLLVSLTGQQEAIDQAILDLRCRGAIVTTGGAEILDIKEPPRVSGLRVKITIPRELVEKPLISDILGAHDLVFNIRTATINSNGGLIVMEITGPIDSIDRAIADFRAESIMVDPIEGNVIE